MSRSRDFGAAAGSLAAPSSANNGYAHVVDTTQSSGWNYIPLNYAGKNAAINGGFDIWQRGTSFSLTATGSFIYGADRWWEYSNAGTCTVSQETSIVPTGFRYAKKIAQSGSTNTAYTFGQALETFNSLQYAGQTVVLSAYLAASASTTFSGWVSYSTSIDNASTGSWTALSPTGTANYTISSTTYNRFSWVFNVPSNAKSLMINLQSSNLAAGTNAYVAGVQLELGSVPTAFSRAGGTLSGELAACQRYFQTNADTLVWASPAGVAFQWSPPVQMRTAPSCTITSSPYYESAVYSTVGSLTNATVLSGHLTSRGGDISITGTFSPAPTYTTLAKIGPSVIFMNAEL
jgi:hypothetical protein